jgi:N-acylneuraminate cytidylyltransferase
MKPLVIIPARGGSKGIPGKNIKILNGKPLIQYTIDAAREVFSDHQICVSTDSEDIKKVAEGLGLFVPFLRPVSLATDYASTYDVLLHALAYYEEKVYSPDVIILLQATSPFRTSKHIKGALESYSRTYDMVVSVTETKSNPYYVLFEEDKDGWLTKSKTGNFLRRQDCPKVWEYNGAIYVINPESLRERSHLEFRRIKKYVMDEQSSLDLDTPLDWKFAEGIMKHLGS